MNAFDTLHFIRPAWLLLLPLALLLPWLWRRSRLPAGDWAQVCDPHLLRWLSVQQGAGGNRGKAGSWLAGLALALAVIALAGPSWEKLPDASYSARDARVVVFDLSRSMLAQDLRPDRLTRARFALADLLDSTREGQVGLISFAGDAYVVSPLTSDMNTVGNLLPALQPDIMPVAGSRADLALELAADLFERSGLQSGEVLLVTDSADARDAARARDLRDRGIFTSVLAVGTVEGAPIPSGTGFVSDRAGNVVIARLDRGRLREVADAGGGTYVELAAGGGAVGWYESDGGEFARRDDSLGERWRDAGPWLVLLLLPLALAAFRRGLLFLLPLLLNGLLLPAEAAAGWWDDLWQRSDQQAYQALQQEEPQRAAALATDPRLSGEAWYRSGDYANATGAWAQADSADAHYNRGNALAHLGDYDAAIEAYDAALALEPAMQDAKINRELVERMKQQQEQEQQEQDQQGDQGESQDSESDSGQQGEESQDAQQQGEEGQDADPQEGEQTPESSDQESGEEEGERSDPAEAWSEEDSQAMEQWLRRIPDDPGGLLRRKFRNQHQQRGTPEDEAESW